MVSTTELFAGRFRLGPLLGQGGMSDVYRAVDESTGEAVAVKIVRSGRPRPGPPAGPGGRASISA